MKKLTLSALIASTLFITACEQAQDATEGAMDKASEMTNSAAEAGKDMASDAMEGFTGSGFHTGTKGHPVGTQADIDALTAEYHEKMKAQ